MNSSDILKRLYKDYSKKFLKKIFLAGLFSIIVATSTSAIAWLFDPAIKKIFIDVIKIQTKNIRKKYFFISKGFNFNNFSYFAAK